MKYFSLLALILSSIISQAQSDSLGIITGSVLDERKKALEGASVQIFLINDQTKGKSVLTDEDGSFTIEDLPFGYHRLRISFVGFQPLTIDSIHIRDERFDFNLNDITLKPKNTENLDEVVIYAEKPLIQSKDGNITFNAGESALSAGSNADELLTNVPLVTKDPTGKIMVRGKEPKILIDDKPVELNQQQLQDLLESLPGSSIEKIEVMTNPPAQYANEQGGVINITTKKGKVGKSGRINLSAGTRGEGSVNGNFNYRKNSFAMNINAGAGLNQFESEGYSFRQNWNNDSTSFRTESNNGNQNLRPNFRANLDYDLNKYHALNLVLHYNQNQFDNENITDFSRSSLVNPLYGLSNRSINNTGSSFNPNTSLSYTLKTKRPGEVFRLINNVNYSTSESTRDYYQQFFNPDYTYSGADSSQQIMNDNETWGYNFRASYDRPVYKNKTFLSLGSFYNMTRSHIAVDANYKRKTDGKWAPLTPLINEFRYKQDVNNYRASVKQILAENFSVTAGLSAERTQIHFDLYRTGTESENDYWSFLPFATINRSWKEKLNVSLAYRRTIRRPGVNELNPTVDSSDLYNIRIGTPGLKPSVAHNLDLVLGKTKKSFYVNLGLGHNIVDDIFNLIREKVNDTTTQITWQNISGKKEYEVSTWSGYTLSKKTRVNMSASYTYNSYNSFDKTVRKFRDGGSFTSNLNANYTWKELYTATGSFTFNRFANPQGSVRSNLSMNIGLQAKLMEKRMTLTLNFIDPFREQQNKSFTYGSNFSLENFNATSTRNFRLSVGYNFIKTAKKQTRSSDKNKERLKKVMQQQTQEPKN